MKKRMMIALAAALCVSTSGCGAAGGGVGLKLLKDYLGGSYEDLYGRWGCSFEFDEDEVKENLEYLQFSEEEMAFAPDVKWEITEVVTFNEDKTYSIGNDQKLFEESTENYFRCYFELLYEHCGEIESYGASVEDFEDAEAFMDVYATSFYEDIEDGDALIAHYVEVVTSWYKFDPEVGTYTIDGKDIGYSINGEEDYEWTSFEINEDVLTIGYADNNYVEYQHSEAAQESETE